MAEKYLISVDGLQELLTQDEVFIIDTRDKGEYSKAHIPHSVNVRDLFTYLMTQENGDVEVLVDHFTGIMRDIGLRKPDKVVIYEDALDNGYGQSCRAWFLLKFFGQPDVRVLNGGYRAWLSRGLSITSEEIERPKSNYQPHLDCDIFVTAEQIRQAIDDPSIIILDNRDQAEWVGASSSPYGIDFCPRKGRIPGAVWIEWYQFMYYDAGIPWFYHEDKIREICRQYGIHTDDKIIIYCFKGSRAANTLLALKMAGFKDARNYFGSWNDWSRIASMPIEEGYG